jgi:intein/homing endonuclease
MKLNLLPLRSTSEKMPLLARIAGVALTDGTLNIYNKKHGGWTPQFQASFGTPDDAHLFEDDVALLGFGKVHILEQDREVHPGERHHTWRVCHNGCLPSLLLALDLDYGNKHESLRKPIPNWIMAGSKSTKREFLSSFQGGDGCKLFAEKRSGRMSCAMTYQSILPVYVESLLTVMKQIEQLLEEFDISVLWVKVKDVKDKVTKEVKANRVRVCLKMSDNKDNLMRYFHTIGYRYTFHKITESAVSVEYVKYSDNGGSMTYPEWVNTIEVKGYAIFVPIKSITEVENQLISDITVEHDNHSFIAGENFLSSNSAMGKQAIGVYASNYRHRFDTMSHVLNYPQKPIVETKISKLINTDEMPCGINVMVAIMTYTGFNQEDSVILNRSAVERGLFSSTFYRTYKEQCNKNHSNGEEEFFTKPSPKNTKGIKPFNYDKLTQDGFIPENTYVDSGDIIIGKCMPQKVDNVISYKDTSITLKENETGFIDKNCYGDKYFTNVNGDGYNFAKVRMRNMRVPTIGDKFCLVPETEVLTSNGWKSIDKVTIEDEVLQLNPDGSTEYVYPTETYEFNHQGDMYHVKHDEVELMTTMNHKMYVRAVEDVQYQLVEAEIMMHHDVFYKSLDKEILVESTYGQVITYAGKVYCLQVPSHIFYVRYKGKGVWTGNSSRHGQHLGCE